MAKFTRSVQVEVAFPTIRTRGLEWECLGHDIRLVECNRCTDETGKALARIYSSGDVFVDSERCNKLKVKACDVLYDLAVIYGQIWPEHLPAGTDR
jgi:hypothetical protein